MRRLWRPIAVPIATCVAGVAMIATWAHSTPSHMPTRDDSNKAERQTVAINRKYY